MPIRQQLSESLRAKSRTADFWMQCSVFVILGFMFWPITHWLAESAQTQSRLLHAFIVLLLASTLLVKFSEIKIENPLSLNKPARTTLYLSFGILLVQQLAHLAIETPALSLLGIPAYACAIAALLLFVFGVNARRIVITSTSTFGVFIFLSTLMSQVDWPLRALAGKWSGWILGHMGMQVQLGIREVVNEPSQLILLVNEHPFHVASECNGFGAIMTCLLIAFLLSVYFKHKPIRFILNVLAGAALGFGFNTLRIVCIVVLAPHMMEHYHLMHEIIGTITYWGGLVITWKLLGGPTNYPTSKPA